MEHHLIKAGDILRGGENSRASKRRTSPVGYRCLVQIRNGGFLELGCRGVPTIAVRPACLFIRRDPEAGVLHGEGIEHSLLQEAIERYTASDFHDTPQNVDAGGRVGPPAS